MAVADTSVQISTPLLGGAQVSSAPPGSYVELPGTGLASNPAAAALPRSTTPRATPVFVPHAVLGQSYAIGGVLVTVTRISVYDHRGATGSGMRLGVALAVENRSGQGLPIPVVNLACALVPAIGSSYADSTIHSNDPLARGQRVNGALVFGPPAAYQTVGCSSLVVVVAGTTGEPVVFAVDPKLE
jgi:hypothetical protein